jgi:hypothetical protein
MTAAGGATIERVDSRDVPQDDAATSNTTLAAIRWVPLRIFDSF